MIRVTRQADLGIVLMTSMAGRPGGTIASARDLAGVTSQPIPMVSKVLKTLARGGMLTSHRGVKGGYSLPRSPDRISVREIIATLDGPIAITDCVDDAPGDCHQEALCPLRDNFQRINDAIRSALEEVKLSEMASPVCFPTAGPEPVPHPRPPSGAPDSPARDVPPADLDTSSTSALTSRDLA